MKIASLLRAGAIVAGGAVLAWGVGFLFFVATLRAYVEPAINDALAPTDAIVVLTGGSERIQTGLDLLQAGKAKKLLVSGVYPGITFAQLAGRQRVSSELQACCISLGHAADNTLGNADETRLWLQSEGGGSVRLVTAHYHMPRSLMVFRAVMPDVVFVPHPVVPESVSLDDWWRHTGTAHLLMMEYNKYLLATLRVALWRIGGEG
jgi:uncharacterized SAM-binding protein YcdF (DUF218 family)